MRFSPHPHYNESGVDWLGVIPSTWQLSRLGSHFKERREKVNDTDYPPLSVTKNGIVPQLETAAKTDDNGNRKKVVAGDFVINSRSDRKGSSGVATTDGSVSLISIVLEPQDLFSGFVHHLLRSIPFQEEFYRHGKGIVADLWSTNFSDMKGIMIPIPVYTEQISISRFLEVEIAKVDDLIAKQELLIELSKEKRQALISHAVTKGLNPDAQMKDSGVSWLGKIPTHWSTPSVFARYHAVLGKMLDEKRQTGSHPIPYLRNANVNWDRIDVIDLPVFDIAPEQVVRFSLKTGDILVCEGGAGVGQTAIWKGEIDLCSFQKALHRLRPRSADEDPRYFYYCMRHVVETGVVLAGGTATIPHLTGDQLRKYRFPRPPICEQQKIVKFLDTETTRIDNLVAKGERGIELMKEHRTSLISAAVTGKIDVRARFEMETAS